MQHLAIGFLTKQLRERENIRCKWFMLDRFLESVSGITLIELSKCTISFFQRSYSIDFDEERIC